MRRCALALLPLVCGAAFASAQGGGSLGLEDVLEAVKADPKLVAEIQAELRKNDLTAARVTCTGFRHDNRWTELSGARAAPYECDIGRRQIVIQADRMYFDIARRPLGAMKTANPKRADSFRELHFRWTWKPLSK